MGYRIDMKGMRFNSLTAIEFSHNDKRGESYWKCVCDCGNQTVVSSYALKSNNTKTCGCNKRSIYLKQHNKIEISGDTATVFDRKGREILIDANCVDKVKDICWCVMSNGYVIGRIDGKQVLMHRFLTNANRGLTVDHINHVRYDNRMKNLRVCTIQQNLMNKKTSGRNKSGIVGVSKSRNGKWRANINAGKKQIRLGTYKTIEEAAKARKEAEKKYFGEFAYNEGE